MILVAGPVAHMYARDEARPPNAEIPAEDAGCSSPGSPTMDTGTYPGHEVLCVWDSWSIWIRTPALVPASWLTECTKPPGGQSTLGSVRGEG